MITIDFTQEDKKKLDHERHGNPDPQIRKKMGVLWLKCCGIAHNRIAKLMSISRRSVARYLNEYKQGGIENLKKNRYRKPVSELDKHQEKVKTEFSTRPPHTVNEARGRIQELTGLKRSNTQIRKFLRRLGLKLRKTAIVPGKVDDAKCDEQQKFKEDQLEPRIKEAQEQKRKLFFVDAAHFVHGAFLCFLWCFQRVFMQHLVVDPALMFWGQSRSPISS